MIDYVLLGYIDILGYAELINKHMDNINLIKGIEKLFQTSIDIIKKYRNEKFENPEHECIVTKILDTIKVRFISDSVIYKLNLPQSKSSAIADTIDTDIVCHSIHLFFNFISTFCTLFIAKTGYVLRGGLSIGPHYETEFNDKGVSSLFIFSKAYIDACKLDIKSGPSRIIIDDNLHTYLKTEACFDTTDILYKDDDGKICFEIYRFLEPYPDYFSEEILTEIKRGVSMNLECNKDNENNRRKIVSFAKYHNARVKKDRLNFEHLSITINH
ncbi:MAG: hypothetical protein ACLP9S_06930 [Syntrophales bacterium]